MSQPYQYRWDRLKPYASHSIFFKHLMRIVMRLMFKIKVHGRENMPKSEGGVILASNHLHAADPGFLMFATRRNWRFIAKKELFKNRASAFLCTQNNAFPVDRDVIDRQAYNYAIRVLKDGRCGLGIFPEGQRSPDGVPQEAKKGVAMIAREAKAAVLPCSLYYEGSLKPRRKVTVRIGKLITFEELGMRESQEATEKIMAEITALWERKHD